ncbi:hypothetical protein [Desulfolutivibrio sp.]|uniref:hypothetical protein n=1 Tax=Desulfolutivibrio sp. TaxID=2773296 RepID=UPI002F962236
MSENYPRITMVAALPGLALRLAFSGEGERIVNLAGMAVGKWAALAESDVFTTACVGEYGGSVEWPGILEVGGDTLWRLAEEQAGRAMSPADFAAWLDRLGMSLTTAAKELGLTRRAVAYYKSGGRTIPRVVMLACRGVEHDKSAR